MFNRLHLLITGLFWVVITLLLASVSIVAYSGWQLWDQSSKLDALQQTRRQAVQSAQIIQRLNDEQAHFERLHQALTTHWTANDLAVMVRRQILDQGLSLEHMQPLPATAGEGFRRVAVQVALSGSYSNIAGWIQNMENRPSLIQIRHVQLVRHESGLGVTAEMDIEVTHYE